MKSLPSTDLASIVARVGPLWDRLRGKRLLITGATGFIGRWMVESLFHRWLEKSPVELKRQMWLAVIDNKLGTYHQCIGSNKPLGACEEH